MWPIATCAVVVLLITIVDTFLSRAEMAGPIEVTLGLWTQVGPRNRAIDRV